MPSSVPFSSVLSNIIMFIIMLLIHIGLGFIPANIAKNKGYRFGLWWFYGTVLFILAIVHIALLPNKNAK